MKFRVFFLLLLVLFGVARADENRPPVELSIAAVGDPTGGVLRAGSTGFAALLFLNLGDAAVCVPVAPRRLGKGRMSDEELSYVSPVLGRIGAAFELAAYDLPSVSVEFLDDAGRVIHQDSSIQMPPMEILDPNDWRASTIVFSTPSKPGTYSLRIRFDNSVMGLSDGTNGGGSWPATPILMKREVRVPYLVVKEPKR